MDLAKILKVDLSTPNERYIKKINLNDLIPNPKNIYELSNIEELADDIQDNGLLDHLIVHEVADNKYMLVAGHRRFEALKKLAFERNLSQFANVDCLILPKTTSDEQLEFILHSSNLNQREISPSERLKAVTRFNEIINDMREQGVPLKGKTRDIIAEQTGLGATQVQKYLNIAKDAELKDAVINGDASVESVISSPRKPKTVALYRKKVLSLKEDTIKDATNRQNKKLNRLISEIEEILDAIEKVEEKGQAPVTTK